MEPDFKSNTGEPELIKDGICYMCTDRCPTKVHVRQGRATQIDMVDLVLNGFPLSNEDVMLQDV